MTYEELEKKQEKEELLFYHYFWKHYIALKKLFMETEKYVAISEDNKKLTQSNMIFYCKQFVVSLMLL